MKKNKTKYIASLGVFCAFAYVLSYLGNVVPIRFAGFLSFDFKDAIIVIAGFALGPLATVAITLVVSFIEMITISQTEFIGFVLNVLSSTCFALIPAIIYKKNRTFKSAIISLGISSALTIVAMLLWNYLITPIYMKVPREAVVGMLLPVFLPFNALKCLINTSLVVFFYKPIVNALRKIKILK
jgi:riboflavin transporter FmnP